jgi:hypothetical protein
LVEGGSGSTHRFSQNLHGPLLDEGPSEAASVL